MAESDSSVKEGISIQIFYPPLRSETQNERAAMGDGVGGGLSFPVT